MADGEGGGRSGMMRLMLSRKQKNRSKTKAAKKIGKVMKEFKKGELNIGKSPKKVKSRKQAVAIALSSARKGY